jgi:fibronectin-binding autotransporter adhesin
VNRPLFSLCTLGGFAVAAAALSSCDPFSPAYQDVQCGVGDSCPSGLLCNRGVCVAERCGDGIIVGDERCDDGNKENGDGCAASCDAASCYVPVTHPTIAAGLADAACSTLYVHSGVYAERVTVSRSVTLAGVGDLPPILDGGGQGTALTVDPDVTATVRRFAISNGKAPTGGGVVNRGTLTLDTVVVTENVASGAEPAGGGIANLGGALTLTGATISKNRLEATGSPAPLTGAGIFSRNGSVRLEGASTIDENVIAVAGKTGYPGRGAGLHATDTAVTIAAASAIRGNTITIDGGTGAAEAQGAGLHLTGGNLTLSGDVVVEDNAVLARGGGIGGGDSYAEGGGFHVSNAAVAIDGAIIRNNKVTAEGFGSSTATGGGGMIFTSTLELKNAVFTANAVHAEGTAATSESSYGRAGGLSLSTVSGTISDSRFLANTVTASSKGASPNVGVSVGGLEILAEGAGARTVTLQRCTIDGNSATNLYTTGAGSAGGLFASQRTGTGTLTVNLIASTVSNNLAKGGTFAGDGGVSAQAGDLSSTMNLNVVNSTISGNRVDSPQGQAVVGGLQAFASDGTARVNLVLASTTITNNRATGLTSLYGGINVQKGNTNTVATFRSGNSVIAGNLATLVPDCNSASSSLLSDGYNLFGDQGNCVLGNPQGERTGDAALAPLADNGGPTLTHAPLTGSQLLNSGNPAGCTDPQNPAVPLSTDQRALPRPAAGRCDIGAVEVQ